MTPIAGNVSDLADIQSRKDEDSSAQKHRSVISEAADFELGLVSSVGLLHH